MGWVVLIIIAALIWFLPIYVAHEIGAPKHRSGFAWGFFLGWLGVIVVALLPPAERADSDEYRPIDRFQWLNPRR